MQVYWGHFFGLFRLDTWPTGIYFTKSNFVTFYYYPISRKKSEKMIQFWVLAWQVDGRIDDRIEQIHGTFSLAWVSKCFSDINVKSISHDTKFRKTVKPFFPNKDKSTNIMNNHFTNITTHLKLKPTKIDLKKNLEIIQNQESIKRIKLTIFHSKSS